MKRVLSVIILAVVSACAGESAPVGGPVIDASPDSVVDTAPDSVLDAEPGSDSALDGGGDTLLPSDTGTDASLTDAVDAVGLIECPLQAPGDGEPCVGIFMCSYGEECCCGECGPSTECTCEDGTFGCSASDFCGARQPCEDAPDAADTPDAPDTGGPLTECPADWPDGGDACVEPLQCSYGQECCCGECDVEYACSCESGEFSCYYTDFCLGRFCSDGCPNQEITTPLGCASCEDAYAGAQQALQDLADSAGGCVADADCQLAPTATTCGPVCHLAVAKGSALALAAGVNAIDAAFCADADWCGGFPRWMDEYWDQPACQANGYARCEAGQCRFAVVCDPALQAVGSPCDDGDACTVGETCTEPFVCAGAPADCDDGDVCTDDACDPATGCAHTENNAACLGFEDLCTIGGQCFFGVCQASPIPGFTREYPGPDRVVRAIEAVPGSGGALVMAGSEGGGPTFTGFIQRIDPYGEPAGPALAAFAPVLDVLPYEDGGLLVTGEAMGQKTDIALTRVDPDSVALWTALIEEPGYDRMPQLAAHPSGIAAVAWSRSSMPETRIALIAADGKVAPAISLGAAADQGEWSGDAGWPRITRIADGFAVAHTTPTSSGEARVGISIVDLTGAVTKTFVLDSDAVERPRGILWTSGSVVIVWGVRGSGADEVEWVRRVTPAGEQKWEYEGPAEHVAQWNSVVIWTHGTGPGGVPRLANVRLDTGLEIWSQILPPADVVLAGSARVLDGIALAGTRYDGSVGTPWLRRTSWVQDCDGGICPPPGCLTE